MGLGFWEITILLLIVAIIFGAGKLPAVMGDLAKGIKSFKSELASDKAEPAPAAAPEAPVPPAPTAPGASPIIEATATRVAMADAAPPPPRTA